MVWGDNKGKLWKKIKIFFHNFPLLSPKTLLSAGNPKTDLWHDGQNLLHEIMHYIYFHNYILLNDQFLRWLFSFAPASLMLDPED